MGVTLPALKAALSTVLEAQQFPVGWVGVLQCCQLLPLLNALLYDPSPLPCEALHPPSAFTVLIFVCLPCCRRRTI